MRKIAKQAVVHHTFMASWVGIPGIAKWLPVACKQLRKQNLKGLDMVSD